MPDLLPASTSSLESIDEPYRGLYVVDPNNDQRHILGVKTDGDDGVEAVFASGLKRNRDQLLGDNARLKTQLADSPGADQIDTWKAASLELDDLKLKATKKKGDNGAGDGADMERVVGEMNTAKATELAVKDDIIAGKDRVIEGLLIDSEVAKLMGDGKDLSGNSNLLLPHIKTQTKVEWVEGEPRVVVKDEAGHPRINATDGTALTLGQLLGEMRERPEYADAFSGSGASGSGASGERGGGGGAPPAANRSQMSDAEKAAYIGKHGLAAFKALPV